jgi:hypothetical protein
VLEVWRWNPNPNQVQFTSSPSAPTSGSTEWSKWVRGGPANTLSSLTGQNAYLVRCAGTTSNSYTVAIPHRPVPPDLNWVRNGANFMGFPSRLANGVYPVFSNYFSTFPAAVAANTKIFKYIGGELTASNPIQVFSPGSERLDRNQAYWFSCEVVGNFYAPIQITFSRQGGLEFGRNGSVITARVMNRSATPVTLNIAPVSSNAAPAGQEPITGPVPLTRRVFDATTASWTELPIVSSYTEVIPAQGSVELDFGINRAAMTGASDAFYASLLRFTDSSSMFDILIPATARKTSLAGFWVGDATVTAVESKAQADAITPTDRGFPLRYLLHLDNNGTARILSRAFIGPLANSNGEVGIATRESHLNADQKAKATRLVSTHLPLDLVLPLSGTLEQAPGILSGTIQLPHNDPTNPFVHQYHPDHDNKSPRGEALPAGMESYAVAREVRFEFTASPPPGSATTSGWGSSVIGGSYSETIQGLHRDTLGIGTGDGLKISGTFELKRVTELGEITLPPAAPAAPSVSGPLLANP